VTSGQGRLDRTSNRLHDRGRRAQAAVAAVVDLRYPGGVDPLVPEQGANEVSGWARTGSTPIRAVVLTVDGVPHAFGRPDPTNDRAATGVATWRGQVHLAPGTTVCLGAVVLQSNGLSIELDTQTVIVPIPPPPESSAPAPPPTSNLELPVAGSLVTDRLVRVVGWSVDDPLARIEVLVDDRGGAARQMALPRTDVAAAVSSPHAGFSGFEHVLDLGDRAPGAIVRIVVDGVAPDGGRHRIGSSAIVVGTSSSSTVIDDERLAGQRARTDRVAARHRPAADGVRILAVTHDLGLGGGQLYLQELLVQLLADPEVRCTVVSPGDGPLRRELEALGVEVHVTGTYPTDPLAHEALLLELAFLAGEQETTVVLVNTAGAACGIDLAARIAVPALWAIHESYAPEHFVHAAYGPGGAHPSAQVRLEEALSTAAAVIFEAEETRGLYCRHGDTRRFVHVAYGIPLDAIDEFLATDDRSARRAALGWSDDDVVLLCVGTIEPRKAQASLLRAFAGISADHPDAVLVLVGDRDDAYGAAVRRYADVLGLGDRVRIEPVVADCYGWYAAADAFVLASDVESLPRSVLEAMAFGLPVVVADVFGLSDLVDDGRTGLLLAPRDLASLQDTLRRLLSLSAEERVALGQRGAAHVHAVHDSKAYAAAFRRLIDGLADDPSALPGELLDH